MYLKFLYTLTVGTVLTIQLVPSFQWIILNKTALSAVLLVVRYKQQPV